MRVRGGDLTLQRPAIAEHAERLERVGREAHRHRRLGEGDDLARIVRDIDAAIVGELGIEDRGDAAEQSATGVGGELGIGYLAGRLRRAERLALEKAVGIAHGAIGKRKAMQHRQAIEPMIIGSCANLEFGRPGAEQRTLQPGRERAVDGERNGVARLSRQRAEACAIGKGGFVQHRILASLNARSLGRVP